MDVKVVMGLATEFTRTVFVLVFCKIFRPVVLASSSNIHTVPQSLSCFLAKTSVIS